MEFNMKKLTNICLVVGAAISMTLSGPAFATLIVNGGFEASTDDTTTPPGWTNIGHEEGVLAYSSFVLPAYEGLYFYDLGGFGASSGPAGDGIMQGVATTVGTTYTLEFGLSSENGVGANDTTLTVCLDISCVDFTQEIDGSGPFAKAFTTQTINFIATDTLTTISFVESINLGIGNNDPMIDNVIFDMAPVPIPAAAWLFGSAILGLGVVKRNRI
jgi:hypothetical protein